MGKEIKFWWKYKLSLFSFSLSLSLWLSLFLSVRKKSKYLGKDRGCLWRNRKNRDRDHKGRDQYYMAYLQLRHLFNSYTLHGSWMLLIRRQRRDFVSVEIFSNQTFIVSIFFWRSIRFLRKLSINVNCQLLMIYGYSMSYQWDEDDFVLVPRDSLFIDGFKHRHES